MSFALIVGTAWLFHDDSVSSPYPGVSNTHFRTCVELSVAWVELREQQGTDTAATLAAHNRWHAQCSRKALRDIARNSRDAPPLPTTPEGWLVAASS